MTTLENIQIKPSFIRSIWFYTRLLLLTILVVETLEIILEPSQSIKEWALKAIVYFILVFIIILLRTRNEQEYNLFIITPYGMTGPSGLLNHERTFIKLEDIDVYKSKKRNIFDMLLGNRYIYTNTNDKININLNLFTRKQIEIIFHHASIYQ
jgi:hypothetical protein